MTNPKKNGSTFLAVCSLLVLLLVAGVGVLVLYLTKTIGGTPASTPEPATESPASLTPEQIACNFISIPDLTECRSTVAFTDETTGLTIPSEIGLLTQLTHLSFPFSMTSTIPTEIGQLNQLSYLSFYFSSLTGTIPSEIGLLTQLTFLTFKGNSLSGTVPSSVCSLETTIFLDCVTCEAGCCGC